MPWLSLQISDAFRKFGMGDKDTSVLLVQIHSQGKGTLSDVTEHIKGEMVDLSRLQKLADVNKIKKVSLMTTVKCFPSHCILCWLLSGSVINPLVLSIIARTAQGCFKETCFQSIISLLFINFIWMFAWLSHGLYYAFYRH